MLLYTTEIAWAKKKKTTPSMTTLKVSLAPQSQVKTGVSDSIHIPAFKYLGTI